MPNARELLDELMGLGFGEDVDTADAGDAEPQTPTPSRTWKGTQLLRQHAEAAGSPAEAEAPEPSELAGAMGDPDDADADADADADEADDADVEAALNSSSVVGLLRDIRSLLQQQVKLTRQLLVAREGSAVSVPRMERRTESAPRRTVAAPSVDTADALVVDAPVVEGGSATEAAESTSVEARRASRLERLRRKATQERQQRAELMAQGLTPDAATERLRALQEAEAAAAEDAAARDMDAAFDDVPMSASEVDDVAWRGQDAAKPQTASTSSRGDGFDVDFDVSAVTTTPARGR